MPCALRRRASFLPLPSRSLACKSTFAISILPKSLLLEELVLAHKDLAHRVFREDVPDSRGEDRSDAEHSNLIAWLVPLQGQGVGDDDLLYGGVLDPLVRRSREDGVGRRGMNLRGAAVEDTLRGIHGGSAGIYYVVYQDGA